mmetsp:Transcript_24026/g.61347  ORF Transcript_24026/g.61347 Transcript_24026/m.61347 type:complete len:484 (+) Transcript_24026:85-1536(+)|eukprot:CAMPEP_0115853326 /NCGR_PEP_ID=MMETSP0287-20121206/13446_1 /TAXON_ID=412157 /ORGANISM="Chrysochromulina rotalis, Strain UIO044" /LENGTH=483 /DNA_ID=CAMNT_0003307399 /DNA_START=85 /DNA_END=1536 /DNA_ORIENTATION=+
MVRARARTSTYTQRGGVVMAEEQDIAFFGACDNRAHLFLLAVALRSVARFHGGAGYFVLAPTGTRLLWTPLLDSWMNGTAEIIELDKHQGTEFSGASTNYSAMTFHRLRMPELLAARGYAYSVNLDPDVLCVARWDLSIFPQVRFVAGRTVRTQDDGTVMWVHERTNPRLNSTFQASGISAKSLRWELNGGVLVFNNVRCVKVQLTRLCNRLFAAFLPLLEGDQDLLSILFAAHPTLPIFKLPTQYNFAFQRDREVVPDALGMRLRLSIYGQLTCVHFVVDGKPWERQVMLPKDYPPWLVATRVYHLREWLKLARTLRPHPSAVLLHRKERDAIGEDGLRLLGRTGAASMGRRRAGRQRKLTLSSSLLDVDILRTCSCYLQRVSSNESGDPLHAFQADESRANFLPPNTTSHGAVLASDRVTLRRSWYHRQRAIVLALRHELLHECDDALDDAIARSTLSAGTKDDCNNVLNARVPSVQHPKQ